MTKQDFSRRSAQAELMDIETVSFEEFHHCLRQLEFINVCTLAYRPTLRWLDKMWRHIQPEKPIFLLDAGSGGGDMLRRIWKWSRKRGFKVTLIGADLNPWSKQSAEKMTSKNTPISFKTTNIFEMNLLQPPDFIISSLFTHHLTDDQLVEFIRWMDKQAVRDWFINDLHRHSIAYYFIKYATRIIPANRLIRHDAPVSVARSFTTSDWQYFLEKSGIPADRTHIAWFFPFRYCVACIKT